MLGNIQLVVSKIGSVPSEDSNQNADTRTGDGSKSIATAVAMVNPAIVYISVPCSMLETCVI